MAGSRMNQTKNALQIFLRSLPVGTKFNSKSIHMYIVALFDFAGLDPRICPFYEISSAAGCSELNSVLTDLLNATIIFI